MAERLGLAVIPGVGWRASEIQAIAREAGEAGFDAICAAEVNNDVMATAKLMGAATRRIQVGTWIANIYVRHSYACAQGAALIVFFFKQKTAYGITRLTGVQTCALPI